MSIWSWFSSGLFFPLLRYKRQKENIPASLNVSFPWTLAAQVSGIFQSTGPSVFSSLIWQLIGLPFFTLQKLFAVSETLPKSKITRAKSIHFKRNYKLSSSLSQQDSTERRDGKGAGTLLKDRLPSDHCHRRRNFGVVLRMCPPFLSHGFSAAANKINHRVNAWQFNRQF